MTPFFFFQAYTMGIFEDYEKGSNEEEDLREEKLKDIAPDEADCHYYEDELKGIPTEVEDDT